MDIHAWLNLNCLVGDCLLDGLSVKTNSLLHILNGFDTSIVEFLQGGRYNHFDRWHLGKSWLINTSKCITEETAFYLGSSDIADIIEWIVLEEVIIKDLIAVLLINVTACSDAIRLESTIS